MSSVINIVSDYEEHVLEVNTEYWLDILKTETFPTTYCPFRIDEAEIFIDIYKRYVPDLPQIFSDNVAPESLNPSPAEPGKVLSLQTE